MKIESILLREGGTKVSLDGVEYHFAPDESGRHVAEVTDKQHIGRLLAIREGYRLADDDAADTSTPQPVTGPEGNTLTPNDDPDTGDTGDEGEAEVGDDDVIVAPEDQDPDTVDIGLLRQRYEQVTGKKAHPSAAAKTLQARILEALGADGEGE